MVHSLLKPESPTECVLKAIHSFPEVRKTSDLPEHGEVHRDGHNTVPPNNATVQSKRGIVPRQCTGKENLCTMQEKINNTIPPTKKESEVRDSEDIVPDTEKDCVSQSEVGNSEDIIPDTERYGISQSEVGNSEDIIPDTEKECVSESEVGDSENIIPDTGKDSWSQMVAGDTEDAIPDTENHCASQSKVQHSENIFPNTGKASQFQIEVGDRENNIADTGKENEEICDSGPHCEMCIPDTEQETVQDTELGNSEHITMAMERDTGNQSDMGDSESLLPRCKPKPTMAKGKEQSDSEDVKPIIMDFKLRPRVGSGEPYSDIDSEETTLQAAEIMMSMGQLSPDENTVEEHRNVYEMFSTGEELQWLSENDAGGDVGENRTPTKVKFSWSGFSVRKDETTTSPVESDTSTIDPNIYRPDPESVDAVPPSQDVSELSLRRSKRNRRVKVYDS